MPALWLLFFLVAPVVIVLVVSVLTPTISGYVYQFTLQNYLDLLSSSSFLQTILTTLTNAIITTVLSLSFGYPIAYYLAFSLPNLRLRFAFFLITLAPFFTSSVVRAIAWIPLMGREGAVNWLLLRLHIIQQPLDVLLFSNFAVRLAMIQLYILFMISPIFFSLSTIDRSLIEAARDMGATFFRVLLEVIIPLSRQGVFVGAIFVFVLSMGDFATVRLIGGGSASSLGLTIQNFMLFVQFPLAAAAASILVILTLLAVVLLVRYGRILEGV
jgi:putative spermidine/putrescine transport system permease protein